MDQALHLRVGVGGVIVHLQIRRIQTDIILIGQGQDDRVPVLRTNVPRLIGQCAVLLDVYSAERRHGQALELRRSVLLFRLRIVESVLEGVKPHMGLDTPGLDRHARHQ